jgi:hypothetical protein
MCVALTPTTALPVPHRRCSELVGPMLQLEAALSARNTVLGRDGRWQGARRRKWRLYASAALTPAQVVVAWSALESCLDWEAAAAVWVTLSRRTCLQLVPTHTRNAVSFAAGVLRVSCVCCKFLLQRCRCRQ